MKIEQIMTKDPTCGTSETTIGEAIAILDEIGKRHLTIVDSEKKVIGILSERDLGPFTIARLGLADCAEADVMLDSKVSEIIQETFVSAHPDDDVTVAIDLIVEQKVGALPILDKETSELRGILSYTDLLKAAKPLFENLP